MARIKEEDLHLNLIIGGDDTRKKTSELRGELSQTKTSLVALEKERAKLSKSGKVGAEESNRKQRKRLEKQLEAPEEWVSRGGRPAFWVALK